MNKQPEPQSINVRLTMSEYVDLMMLLEETNRNATTEQRAAESVGRQRAADRWATIADVSARLCLAVSRK